MAIITIGPWGVSAPGAARCPYQKATTGYRSCFLETRAMKLRKPHSTILLQPREALSRRIIRRYAARPLLVPFCPPSAAF